MRTSIGALFGALICLALPNTAVAEDFDPGSLIIPMDTSYQDDGMLKAYGLIYHLLLDGVPINWCIKPGKAFGDADFTATAEDYQTSASLTHDYRGGPFVIDSSFAATASTRIDDWQMNNVTTVHRSTATFSCDVSRRLVNAPTIAMVADGNQKIARGYLEAAGIPDSTLDYTWPDSSPDMLDIAELSGPTTTDHRDGALFDDDGEPVYCQLMSMHWGVNDAEDDPEVVAEVREYLNFPTHFFAECQAVNAFENNAFGRFLTPNGFLIGDEPNDVDFYHADVPFAQLDGGWETVGGSEPAYSLPPGDSYKASDITMVTEQGTPEGVNDIWMTGFLDGVCPPELEVCTTQNFGKISYLGGHEYDTKLPISTNPKTQGTRMFLNSLFEAPCATEGGRPIVELEKFGSSLVTQNTVTWTIEYQNSGVSSANNVQIRDTLPPGATFVSATQGGSLVGNEVVWDIGGLVSSEIGSVDVTVTLGAEGDYDNTAVADYNAGLNDRAVTSNTVTTTYCVPDDDSAICQMSAVQCGTVDISDNCGQTRTVDCGTDACGTNAVCNATNQCACDLGYTGDGVTCTDIDECTTGADNCSADATCTNADGGFDCTCSPGFTGDGVTCTDIDECADATLTCGTNATCSNLPGTAECVCDSGYMGDGVTCTDIDECADGTATCDANASCTNTVGGFDCACDIGFVGDGTTCTDVDECANGTASCSANASCNNLPGMFECVCDSGYEGDGTTCSDIDECATNTDTCDANATCTNDVGGFSCACRPGFTGDGMTCTDVDECADGTANCAADAMCQNEAGGFTCTCLAGFEGDGTTCTPIDCACADDEVCVNDVCYPSCQSDSECADNGEACHAGRCVTNACVGVSCSGSETCAGGTCFDTCATVVDCAEGDCIDGRCAADACAGIVCGTAEICRGGSCFGACSADDECPGDERCFDGGCAADACVGISCPVSEVCVDGGCFPPCDGSVDCSDPTDRCYEERCASSACEFIVCAEGEACIDGGCFATCADDGDCVDGSCIDGRCAGDACEGIDCADGETCADGTCVLQCSDDASCPEGLRCSDGECTDSTRSGAESATEGCGCASASGGADATFLFLGLLGLARLRRRRRRS